MGFSGRAMLTQQDFKMGFCLRAPEIKKHYETPRCVCVCGWMCIFYAHARACELLNPVIFFPNVETRSQYVVNSGLKCIRLFLQKRNKQTKNNNRGSRNQQMPRSAQTNSETTHRFDTSFRSSEFTAGRPAAAGRKRASRGAAVSVRAFALETNLEAASLWV